MKKLRPLFFILSLTFIGCTNKNDKFSEKEISDSLSTYLTLANEETISSEKRLDYTNKAHKILSTQDNDSLNRKNLFKVANRYYNIKNFEKYKSVTAEIIKKSLAKKDTLDIAKAYSYIADYYANSTKKDSAYYYYKKAEKIYLRLNDKAKLGSIYVNIASVQSYESDFLGSEISAIKSLDALRGTEDYEKMFDAYIILGFITNEVKNYEKSLEYNTKALDIANKYNLTESNQIAISLNNIGHIYQDQNNDQLALQKFEEALKNNNLEDNPDLHAILIDNLAYSKFKLKDYSQLPDLFYKSLKIRDSLNFTVGIIHNKIHLSEFYIVNQDTLKAKKYANEAYDLSKNTKNFKGLLSSLKQLVIVDPTNASTYSNKYIKLNDSLLQAERKSKDKFARISFETDEYIIQNDKLEEQNRKIIFSGIIIVLFGILIFVIKSQQSRNKEFSLKQEQQKANEEIYNLMLFQQQKIDEGRSDEKERIAQELHDGILGRLFGARLNLDSLNKRVDENGILSRNNFISQLKSIEEDIREISHDLSREKNEVNNNFLGIFNNLIEQQENISEAKVNCNVSREIYWDKIENNIKINIYRILQESLQNINKYAKAQNITIEISQTNDYLHINICDDGLGFHVTKRNKGIGLKNIISRTEACKGFVEIKSEIDKGTSIFIKIPSNQQPT